jgi:uncharacterized protein (DUF885 family)
MLSDKTDKHTSKHWTRQQVIDYFHESSGIDEVNVQSETDRYMAWPAQALGYKMGQLDLRGFHGSTAGLAIKLPARLPSFMDRR